MDRQQNDRRFALAWPLLTLCVAMTAAVSGYPGTGFLLFLAAATGGPAAIGAPLVEGCAARQGGTERVTQCASPVRRNGVD
jgi:hypothetical protein